MMQQFFQLKEKHPDAIILFRCGDFYETYADDAKEASEILGITLTKRSNGASGLSTNTLMAGFPHHALDTYLPKLIRAGKRVAICDQLEDPKLAKKLVKRGITEVVTPGVLINDNVLVRKENNFLAAVYPDKGSCGIALLDISTGEFLTSQGTLDYIEKLLTNFMPKEVLIKHGTNPFLSHSSATMSKLYFYSPEDWMFNEETARTKLKTHFGTKSLKGFGINHLSNGIVAAGAILFYIEHTQHTHISHIRTISRIEENGYVHIDYFTLRSLELIESMNDGGKSLLSVIDKTLTPMGGRLLRRWLVFPLLNTDKIKARQHVVEFFFRYPDFRSFISEQFGQIGDIERIASKIATGRVSPRDYIQLKTSLQAITCIASATINPQSSVQESDNTAPEVNFSSTLDAELHNLGQRLASLLADGLSDLCNRIESEIVPDPPYLINKGGVILKGVNTELDELRQMAYSGKDYLLQMQQREINQTGIQSLKIGFNNVYGYYMEVRNTFKDKVPSEWIRKQTLVTAERYITQELKEYEEKILGAEERILNLETQIFNNLTSFATQFIPLLQSVSALIAELDCLHSFAQTAIEYKYVCPVVDDSTIIDIHQGRHPVIERQMPLGEQYISNDVYLDTDTQQIIIITGPNMAGKSALLRQTALITILAQIGSFVPAESARIGMVDKIFTRVGATDNISLGESTFMVEMTESASIINNLSHRSLVLFDELGRGTSTYDGISIAWAIIEYMHENPQYHPRTLFATHYHELNEMERKFQRIRNYNVSVHETDGKILFLRKLIPGGSEHSFGIHVAKIAGMLPSVVKRSEEILHQLENETLNNSSSIKVADGVNSELSQSSTLNTPQLSFFQLDDPVLCQIRDELIHLDVNNLTPLEALNKLNEIKKIIKGGRG